MENTFCVLDRYQRNGFFSLLFSMPYTLLDRQFPIYALLCSTSAIWRSNWSTNRCDRKKVRHREKENKREKFSHTNSSRDRDREVQSSGKSYIKLALTVAAMALWTLASSSLYGNVDISHTHCNNFWRQALKQIVIEALFHTNTRTQKTHTHTRADKLNLSSHTIHMKDAIRKNQWRKKRKENEPARVCGRVSVYFLRSPISSPRSPTNFGTKCN